MTDRNVREVLNKLGLSSSGNTLDEIRVAYIRYLRDLASGRGGDDQYGLTRNRAREAEMSANLKELQIAKETRQLVPADEVEAQIVAMITAARTELLTLPDKIAMSVKTLEGVDIDPSLITELIHESLQHLANGDPRDPGGSDDPGAEDLGAAA